MKPKVLRLITRLNIGGPARQALLLSRTLSDRFATTLCAGEPPAAEGELGHPDVEVHRLPLFRQLRPLDDAKAIAQVRGLLRSHDIVHTHMAKAGAVGRLAASTLKTPPVTIHTFHGHVLDEYFSPVVQRTFIELERRLAQRTDVLVAISPEVRDSLLEKGIGSPDRFRIIPLGFELEPFLSLEHGRGRFRSSVGIPEGVPLIAILGRLAPIKSHDTILRAMRSMDDVHLAVVGDGELRDALEALTRSLGIAARVHFIGWRLDVAEILSDVDLVVLTSKNEGTPVSLIESLAAARAVVATDVGGVRYVVNDGVTGLLCPVGDPTAVAAAVEKLVNDPHMRSQMGMAGREDVRTRFGSARLTTDIKHLYEELLQDK